MKSFIACVLLVAAQACSALSPTPGLWWNPNEGGRGYAIDVQNGVMVVTFYVYDTGGAPLWYLASGVYTSANSTFSAQLGEYTGGQCFGCPYTGAHGAAAGNVSIVFDTLETGTLFYPGGSTRIQHELYGYPDKQSYLFGEWTFGENIGGVIDAQWMVFNTTYTSSGTLYAAGFKDNYAGSTALGQFDPSSGEFIIASTDSTGFYNFYYLKGDDHHMLGVGEIVAPGGSPTGGGLSSAGNRILDKVDLNSSTLAKSQTHPDDSTMRRLSTALDSAVAARAIVIQ